MKINVVKLLFFLSSLSLCETIDAQIENFGKVLTSKTNGGYLGQYADNHKTKSGTGIDRAGDGVYIGDFKGNKYNGKGMQLRGEKFEIKNAPDAYAYIGGWINGKKDGQGICYAPNGDIIYQGKWENDKPVGEYPSPQVDELKYFSFMEIDNGMFVGEIYQGTPDGYGIFIEPDGTYWIGNYKDGLRKGVGMFIYGPDAWSVVNYKNGECIEINSSDIYNSRRQTFQEASARFKSELWGEFLDVAMGLSKVGSDFIEMKYGSKGNAESGESGDDSGGSSSSGSKSSAKSKNSKGKGDCGTAWMSESRSYSNYETLLATGKADGSDISSIKSKMKRIRQKWEQRGCPITKSPYED